MMYRHTARFQILLRDALRLQSVETILARGSKAGQPYTDQNMLDALGVAKGRTTLTKFRNARFPSFDDPSIEHMDAASLKGALRDPLIATALWEHLSTRGYIAKAIADGPHSKLNKRQMYSQRQVANTLAAFYDTNEEQIAWLTRRGLTSGDAQPDVSGEWFCYKKSWYEPDHIVKSKFDFSNEANEYFSVSDYQRISGRFCAIDQQTTETSTGFAISKSNKIWCFMREAEFDQPRIFCFYRPILAHVGDKPASNLLTVIYGHVMEAERRQGDRFYSNYAILVSLELDRREWLKALPDKPYRPEEQIDVYPIAKPGQGPRKNIPYHIPRFVIDYLCELKPPADLPSTA